MEAKCMANRNAAQSNQWRLFGEASPLTSSAVCLPWEGAPTRGAYHYGADAVEFLESLPQGEGISVITSPPYNLGLRARGVADTKWPASRLMGEGYDAHDDNMPRAEYVEWQQDMLAAAQRVAGYGGVVLYNHKPVHRDGLVSLQQDILGAFPVRDYIVWNRGSGINHQAARLTPIWEFIAVIPGIDWQLPEQWRRDRPLMTGNVWNITPERGTEHPAPFPLELATALCKMAPGDVADPFAGSGTVGVAAAALGKMAWLGDLSDAYHSIYAARMR